MSCSACLNICRMSNHGFYQFWIQAPQFYGGNGSPPRKPPSLCQKLQKKLFQLWCRIRLHWGSNSRPQRWKAQCQSTHEPGPTRGQGQGTTRRSRYVTSGHRSRTFDLPYPSPRPVISRVRVRGSGNDVRDIILICIRTTSNQFSLYCIWYKAYLLRSRNVLVDITQQLSCCWQIVSADWLSIMQ